MGEARRRKLLLGDRYGKPNTEVETEFTAVDEFKEAFLKRIRETIYSKLPDSDVEIDDQFVVKMLGEMKEEFCADPQLEELAKRAFSSPKSN